MQHQLPPYSRYLALVVPSLLFLVCSVALQWRGLPVLDTDSYRYIAGARALVEYGALLDQDPEGNLRPDPIRTPGYPLFLAAIGTLHGGVGSATANLKTVTYQHLIWWGMVLILVALATGKNPIRRPWLLGLSVGACLLSPPVLLGNAQIMSDSLYAALNALGCAGLVLMTKSCAGAIGRQILATGAPSAHSAKPPFSPIALALGTGIVFGMATSVRPVGSAVPFLLAFAVLLWAWIRYSGRLRRRLMAQVLLPLGVMAFAASLPPAYWIVRNYQAYGMPQQTSLGGLAILLHRQAELIRHDPATLAEPGSPSARLLDETRRTGDLFHAGLVVQREFRLNPFEVSVLMQKIGLELLRRAPQRWAVQVAVNGLNLVCAPADGIALLSAATGPRMAYTKTMGQALRDRDTPALGVQLGLRILGLVLHGALPILLLVLLLRRCQPSIPTGAPSPQGHTWAWITARRIPLLVWLIVISAGWSLAISAAVTITYGRFALPMIPVITALGAAASIQKPCRQ